MIHICDKWFRKAVKSNGLWRQNYWHRITIHTQNKHTVQTICGLWIPIERIEECNDKAKFKCYKCRDLLRVPFVYKKIPHFNLWERFQ